MTAIVVVGVDLALTVSGLITVAGPGSDYRKGTGPQLLRQVRIVTKDLRGYQRLNVISNAVQENHEWLVSRVLRPTVYVFEGPGFSSKVAHSLGQLHGVVKMDLLRRADAESFSLLDVPPSTLKKFVTGKGIGEKNVIMKWVCNRWGFDSDFDDECDAYACSICGLCLYGSTSPAAHRKLLENKVVVHACPDEEGESGQVIVTPISGGLVTIARQPPAAAGAVAGRFRRRRIL